MKNSNLRLSLLLFSLIASDMKNVSVQYEGSRLKTREVSPPVKFQSGGDFLNKEKWNKSGICSW